MQLANMLNANMYSGGNGSVVKHLTLTADSATYQMQVTDHILIVTSSAADAAGIVTLPPVAEAAGQFYYISAPTGATGGDVSVYIKETAAEVATYGDLDADGDHVILFSDGYNWRVVLDGVA